MDIRFFAASLCAGGIALTTAAQPLQLPTSNRAIFEPGAEEKFYVGTTGKPWQSGTFGCVRSEGGQMHEGLDIRAVQRDRRGEPTDPVMAAADGTVAYVNRRVGASNYGNYVVLRHTIDGMEVFTLYAHLGAFADGLQPGKPVKTGQVIATMGRTSNTRERISKERAHVHFEVDLFLNDRFSAWYRKSHPRDPDDHGPWNGINLVGLDPRLVLLEQQAKGKKFNLVEFVRSRPELCKVLVRDANFAFVKRYPMLVTANPTATREGVAGYEIVFDYNGVPIQLTPRAASEIKSKARYQVLSVNTAEQQRNRCRQLVMRRGNGWDLSSRGADLLNLITE